MAERSAPSLAVRGILTERTGKTVSGRPGAKHVERAEQLMNQLPWRSALGFAAFAFAIYVTRSQNPKKNDSATKASYRIS
jgi:hypothetical protein